MKIGRSEEGRKNRQAIVDFLKTNGPSSCRQICDALGTAYATTLVRLGTMQHHAEVSAESVQVPKQRPMLVFTAQVDEVAAKYATGSGCKKDLRTIRREKRTGNYSHPKPRVSGPHHTIHLMDDHPPIRNQGGQGSVPRGCSHGSMIASIFMGA